jgi:hypothetical protein
MLVANVVTKQDDKIDDRHIRSKRAADRFTSELLTSRRARLRQGEKVIALCQHAWKVVHRLYPEQFNKDVPNP